MSNTATKWESRKLFIAISFEFLSTFLLWADKIQASNWETITMTILGSYMISQGYVDARKRT